jgi:cytochrome c oxidase cbb3-type subunit 3
MAAEKTPDIDRLSGVATTGHEWDGLKELNHPLPRWWLWTLYATIVWGVLYSIAYPAWPLVSSYTTGFLGYASRAAVVDDLNELRARRGANGEAFAKAPIDDVAKNAELLAFARALGKSAFGDNCAGCHGQGGTGAKAFPNLVDDDWMWGGTLAEIEKTIRFGIRSTHDETRVGNMPAFGKDNLLKPDEIEAVADYALTLANLKPENPANVAKGAALFKTNCASCHNEDGKGKADVGGPNLTDGIWLYGSDRKTIVEGIVNGRGAMMPHWVGRLDDMTIKALAVYVHGLGGGK